MLGNGSRTRWGVAEQIAAAGESFSRFKVDKKQRYLVDGRDSRSQGKRQRYFHTPCLYLAEGKAAGESNVRAAHSNNLFQRSRSQPDSPAADPARDRFGWRSTLRRLLRGSRLSV